MFNADVDIRVNTVNCVGVMGAGVALAFKTRYPAMFKDYKAACRDGRLRPGAIHVWRSLDGDWVVNFPTKRDWRESSRYDDIESGLNALHDYLREQGNVSVALPALGCGHGGLDWSRVAPMITTKLSDLEARILVYEPSDSIAAGQDARRLSADELHEVKLLGFEQVAVNEVIADRSPETLLAKGDFNLLAQEWIALVPSKEPSEREENALNAVAQQLALSRRSPAVAMVYTTRNTERIADLFLKCGVPVVLILPFGPLTRKAVSRLRSERQPTPFAMVSLSTPSAKWSRQLLAQTMHLWRSQARSILLTDPDPSWLNSSVLHGWSNKPLFYLRYECIAENLLVMLNEQGARPIGRRSDTGEPNLALLLQGKGRELAYTS